MNYDVESMQQETMSRMRKKKSFVLKLSERNYCIVCRVESKVKDSKIRLKAIVSILLDLFFSTNPL